MNQAFYDSSSGHVWMTVGGQLQPYPPHTLVAAAEGDGMVSVRRVVGGGLLAMAEAAAFLDRAGQPIGDAAAVTVYLNDAFAQGTGPTRGPRGPGIFSGDGDPDAAFGLAGDLYLHTETGDIFTKEA